MTSTERVLTTIQSVSKGKGVKGAAPTGWGHGVGGRGIFSKEQQEAEASNDNNNTAGP